CDVDRADGPDANFSVPAEDQTVVDVGWDAANSQDAERDAFYSMNVAHDYIKALDPAFVGNDYPMRCIVNIDRTCNAFSDGAGFTFSAAGGGCPTTATMPDVVYHEYGHAVNDNLYIQAGSPLGMQNSTLHEATADVNASFIHDSPDIGKGFYGPGTVLRSLHNSKRWPEDNGNDAHITCLILGG